MIRNSHPPAPLDVVPREPGLGDAAVPLLVCPFCDGEPAWEAHPAFPDALRIACRGPGCVQPATEYLLAEFGPELAARWNARPGHDRS